MQRVPACQFCGKGQRELPHLIIGAVLAVGAVPGSLGNVDAVVGAGVVAGVDDAGAVTVGGAALQGLVVRCENVRARGPRIRDIHGHGGCFLHGS